MISLIYDKLTTHNSFSIYIRDEDSISNEKLHEILSTQYTSEIFQNQCKTITIHGGGGGGGGKYNNKKTIS